MKIRGYMATSVDGYIADRDGGIDWLKPFDSVDAGYASFIEGIGTVVSGRATYDQVRDFPGGWGFEGKRSIIVTSRPLGDSPPGIERWEGNITTLIAELRAAPDEKAAWVVGGAALQAAFLEAGAIDTLDLFVIPVLLGDGVRMFPPSAAQRPLRLLSAEALGLGMVRLSYAAEETA